VKLIPYPTPDTIIAVDAWSAPIWEAAMREQLTAAQCNACGTFRMQPAPFCPSCLSQDLRWPVLSGRGSLYSFTFARHPHVAKSGYCVAVIELEDAPGIRIISNIVEADSDDLAIGMPIEIAYFQPLAGNYALPMFRPIRSR
jgi:uncharacterized OB-fold protein